MKPPYRGFTLAEVLITIAIIGIVAAITIPTLLSNIQDRKYITASKLVNSMFSNSIAFVEANEGIQSASDPEDFVRNYLSQYLKISKICGYENYEVCGFETKTNGIHKIDDEQMTLPTKMDDLQVNLLSASQTLNSIDRRGYSFITSNGYSMMLFYNPKCRAMVTNTSQYVQDTVCVNIVWDMNGQAEPNQVGKDIGFTTVLYPKYSSIITPLVYRTNTSGVFADTETKCKSFAGDAYRTPNRNELASMVFNGNLINQTSGYFWSSETVSAELAWYQDFNNGYRGHEERSYGHPLRCVRK